MKTEEYTLVHPIGGNNGPSLSTYQPKLLDFDIVME